MAEGEHTHEGDACTCEVLARRFLAALGETVHHVDLEDGSFGRPETEGVAATIAGIALVGADDHARIAAGTEPVAALGRRSLRGARR